MASGPEIRRPSPAVEDYLKAVWHISEEGHDLVTTSRVATDLGVTPASASNMLKRLAGMGYVSPLERGVTLTGEGRAAALEVVRHHRLLETFLAEVLGVPLDRVHAEAEILEHHISEDLEARIAAALGDPARDPHGDPIPTVSGHVDRLVDHPLSDLPCRTRAVISRVGDRDPEIVAALAGIEAVPGSWIESERVDGGYLVRTDNGEVLLPAQAGEAVRVHQSGSRPSTRSTRSA